LLAVGPFPVACLPPLEQPWIDRLPANAMVRRLTHLDGRHYQRCNKRDRKRDRPARSVEDKSRGGERGKHTCPRKLKCPTGAQDIAKEEKMPEYEADDESRPPGHHNKRARDY
jgi:hypothetical protein